MSKVSDASPKVPGITRKKTSCSPGSFSPASKDTALRSLAAVSVFGVILAANSYKDFIDCMGPSAFSMSVN